MEKFFEAGTLTEEELLKGLKQGIIKRDVYPVLCMSGKQDTGVARFMQFVGEFCPAPNEMPVHKSADGKEIKCVTTEPAAALIFKTSIEPHIGQVSFFKLYSGEITEGMDLVNSFNGSKERFSQLFAAAGKTRNKVEKIVAGDIAATIKLKDVHTNNSIVSPKSSGFTIAPIIFRNQNSEQL